MSAIFSPQRVSGDAAFNAQRVSGAVTTDIDCSVGVLVASGLPATISIATVVDCSAGSLSLTGLPASLDLGTTINAGLGSIAATGLPAQIVTSTVIECEVGQLAATGLQAGVELVTAVHCGIGELVAASLGADIVLGITINASVGTLATDGLPATIVVTASSTLTPNPARTITVPSRRHAVAVTARAFAVQVPARIHHFIVRDSMIYRAESKRSDESPVFSLDIKKVLALTGDTISSVTAACEVETGADPDVADMLIGDASVSGTIISQRVGAGVDGNTYNLRFEVTTPQQVLSFVMSIPVDDEGAFE